jgi:hypothetical protein
MRTYTEHERVRVEVRHRGTPRTRYTWELHGEYKALPFKESREQYGSWEEASRAGKAALKVYLHS